MENKVLTAHYLKNYDRLVTRSVNRVPNRSFHLAEECVQESYARAIKYFKAFDPTKHKFDNWFEGILRNVINNCRGAEGNYGVVYELNENQGEISVNRDEKVKVLLLTKHIEANKHQRYRDVLNLFFIHGFKSREISEYLNMKHTTVRQIIFKFREHMNEIFKGTH